MVKECTLLNGAQWLKSKNSVGFSQYFSVEINKVDTIYCDPAYSFQTFDMNWELSHSHFNLISKQKPYFPRIKKLWYHQLVGCVVIMILIDNIAKTGVAWCSRIFILTTEKLNLGQSNNPMMYSTSRRAELAGVKLELLFYQVPQCFSNIRIPEFKAVF